MYYFFYFLFIKYIKKCIKYIHINIPTNTKLEDNDPPSKKTFENGIATKDIVLIEGLLANLLFKNSQQNSSDIFQRTKTIFIEAPIIPKFEYPSTNNPV